MGCTNTIPLQIHSFAQTAQFMHPTGSITGAPGRNAAVIMLEDLGFDPRELMRPRAEAAV